MRIRTRDGHRVKIAMMDQRQDCPWREAGVLEHGQREGLAVPGAGLGLICTCACFFQGLSVRLAVHNVHAALACSGQGRDLAVAW